MTSQLTLSLFITLIGMGLVFASLLLLAFLMNVLVSITTRSPRVETDLPAVQHAPDKPDGVEAGTRLAAAIAVAMALDEPSSKSSLGYRSPTSGISAWMQAHRARLHARQGKPR